MTTEGIATSENESKAIQFVREEFCTWNGVLNFLLYEYDDTVHERHPAVICLRKLVDYVDSQVDAGDVAFGMDNLLDDSE